jgi:hypothetical protein
MKWLWYVIAAIGLIVIGVPEYGCASRASVVKAQGDIVTLQKQAVAQKAQTAALTDRVAAAERTLTDHALYPVTPPVSPGAPVVTPPAVPPGPPSRSAVGPQVPIVEKGPSMLELLIAYALGVITVCVGAILVLLFVKPATIAKDTAVVAGDVKGAEADVLALYQKLFGKKVTATTPAVPVPPAVKV